MNPTHVQSINELSKEIHQNNVTAGWWSDLNYDKKLQSLVDRSFQKDFAESILTTLGIERSILKTRNVGELLCLVHSEVSEAMEGYRKNLMDDKLPHRTMFETELADVFIRLFDIAGAHNLDIGGAIAEKRAFNAKRADHKIENRQSENGKKF